MRTIDLSPEEISCVSVVSLLAYSAGGKSSVDILAASLEWDEFGYCEPCEAGVPLIAGACMVCWTAINPEA